MPAVATVPKARGSATQSDAQHLYDHDFWSWAQQQAKALRERRFDDVDWPNLLEEVEDLAGRHEDSWRSLCRSTLIHLMKIQYCSGADNATKWASEVSEWRREMYILLRTYPGMKSKVPQMFASSWETARRDIIQILAEYEVPQFGAMRKDSSRKWNQLIPDECPYNMIDVIGFRSADLNTEKLANERWPASVERILSGDSHQDAVDKSEQENWSMPPNRKILDC